ncbi:MAG: phosphate propanoyltransferase [Firmicutes bacterium]|nr:phosphate propanoyltransferase [Bacillota bacterium]
MTEPQLNAIVEAVLASLPAQPMPPAACPLIPVESSARHVHLTKQAVEKLFGPGAALTKKRALSQPGEFLSEQRVKLVTPAGELGLVAVLGPVRNAVQVEISATDACALGIDAPIRLSGNLGGAADVALVGPAGVFETPGSVIVARAHVHMTPADARKYNVSDGDTLRVRVNSARAVAFEHVIARVSDKFALAMHIDFDEANACALAAGDMGTLMLNAECFMLNERCVSDEKLITEERAKSMIAQGKLVLRKGTIITPAARDVFTQAKTAIEFI